MTAQGRKLGLSIMLYLPEWLRLQGGIWLSSMGSCKQWCEHCLAMKCMLRQA